MNKFDWRITVFTPTYNRGYIIGKLYRSLQCQEFRDFEWLVIDDGSTDNTYELFQQWMAEKNEFPIRYYIFENSGKAKEINRGLDLAKGELFFTVDSDDFLAFNALSLIDQWEKTLPRDSMFCGIAGNHGDFKGNATNTFFAERWRDVTFFDRDVKSKHFIGYDRPWVFYTDIHRQYKYPEITGEKFMTEAVAWNRMAHDGYKIRCFNEVIYLWEHQEIGYTNNISSIFRNNPKGYALWQKEWMEFCNYKMIEKLKVYYNYYCEFGKRFTREEIAKYIGASKWQILLINIIYKLKHR